MHLQSCIYKFATLPLPEFHSYYLPWGVPQAGELFNKRRHENSEKNMGSSAIVLYLTCRIVDLCLQLVVLLLVNEV